MSTAKPTTPKKSKSKSAAHGPGYSQLITEAIVGLKKRKGASRQAIKKFIETNHKVAVNPTQFRLALNRAVASGVLVRVTEHSFRLSADAAVGARKKKPGVKAAKKVAASTSATGSEAKPKKATKKKTTKKKAASAKPKSTKKAGDKSKVAATSTKKKAPSAASKKKKPATKKKAKATKGKAAAATTPAA